MERQRVANERFQQLAVQFIHPFTCEGDGGRDHEDENESDQILSYTIQ